VRFPSREGERRHACECTRVASRCDEIPTANRSVRRNRIPARLRIGRRATRGFINANDVEQLARPGHKGYNYDEADKSGRGTSYGNLARRKYGPSAVFVICIISGMNSRIKDSIDLARLRGIEFQMAKHVSHNCVYRRSIYSFRSLLRPLATTYCSPFVSEADRLDRRFHGGEIERTLIEPYLSTLHPLSSRRVLVKVDHRRAITRVLDPGTTIGTSRSTCAGRLQRSRAAIRADLDSHPIESEALGRDRCRKGEGD